MSNVTRVMANLSTSITDFKANPNAILKQSNGEAVAVLKSNEPSFYVVPPELFETMFDAMEDLALILQAKERLNDGQELIDIEVNEL